MLGTVKSYLFLDNTARRIISRINAFTEQTWLIAVYSLKTWLLVVLMMLLGIGLKYSTYPTIILCFIYFTVGWALLFSSRKMWRAFIATK